MRGSSGRLPAVGPQLVKIGQIFAFRPHAFHPAQSGLPVFQRRLLHQLFHGFVQQLGFGLAGALRQLAHGFAVGGRKSELVG